MPKVRLLLPTLLVGCLASLAPLSAQQGTSTAALSEQDYREIKALVKRYNLGWDNASPDDGGLLVGKTFTRDVIFINNGGIRLGRKAVADSSARYGAGIQHWTSNLIIEPTPDGGATGWSYVLLVRVDAAGNGRIGGGGVYRDVYEKTPEEGWLIKRRFYDAAADEGGPSWPWDQRIRRWESVRPTPALKLDQVHFAVTDPASAVDWYQSHIGGTRLDEPIDPRLMLGDTRLIFMPHEDPAPSAGSVFDHVAFSVEDVDSTIAAMEADGAQLVQAPREEPGRLRFGIVDDPWGIRIEVLHDPSALGFHHVHLRVPDPERSMVDYLEAFGGETGRVHGAEGIRYGPFGNWILFDRGNGLPSEGRGIDHLGWDTPALQETYRLLESRGATFLTEPRSIAFFMEGLDGDKLEVVQRQRGNRVDNSSRSNGSHEEP